MINLSDLSDMFVDEEIFLLGGYQNEIPLAGLRLHNKIVISTGAAFALYPNAQFWCAENFVSDWNTYGTLLQKKSSLKIFSPGPTPIEDVILYNPYPLWALPDELVEDWKAQEKGNDCPIALGDICLGLGLAYRLGARRVVEWGMAPSKKSRKYDIRRRRYLEDSWVSKIEQDRLRGVIRRTTTILGMDMVFNSRSLRGELL